MERSSENIEASSAATSVDKALDLLFHIGVSQRPLALAEIGRALGLPKSSAHRLLAALKRRDLVEQDELGRYAPGHGLLGLTAGASLLHAAHPVLAQAADELGETFFLVAARGGALLVLDKAEGTSLLRGSPALGSTVPVHAAAAGKLYLAHAPEEVKLEQPLRRFTPRTLLSLTKLDKEVKLAKRSGYALSQGEWIDGLSVAAAPLFYRARMLGTVCVAVPSVRLPELGDEVMRAVQRAAAAIDARLGGVE